MTDAIHIPSLKKRSFLQARVAITAALVLREMAARYGRSPGGYVWAILQPLGMIMVLSIGFSLLFRTPPLGNSFFLFYATGFIPFNTYQTTTGVVMSTFKFSKSLLVYPVVTWFDAIMGRLVLNTLTAYLIAILIFMGTFIIAGTAGTMRYTYIIEAMLGAVALAAGVGMLNACISSFYPVWTTFWAIVTRPLFLASGVIYIYDELPRTAQNILWYNPLLHITGMMRQGFFPGYTPDYISHTYVWAIIVVLIAVGIVVLRRFHREIVNS